MKTHNLTYALALVAAMILAAGVTSMAQPSNTPAPGRSGTPERSGTLNAPAKFQIMAAGKEIGASTLPAGTKVAVIREEGGKTLVKASLGETWVESAAVAVEEQPQPAAASSPVNLVPDGKGGSYAQPATAQAQPEPAAKPLRREDTAEYKSARAILDAQGSFRAAYGKSAKKNVRWYFATPIATSATAMVDDLTNLIHGLMIDAVWEIWITPRTKIVTRPDGKGPEKELPDRTRMSYDAGVGDPLAYSPKKNEAYYDSLKIGVSSAKDAEAGFDAFVWTSGRSLPTAARIEKQIESGAVVFLEKDCAENLRCHPEFKDLIPAPSKETLDLVRKKNVVVYTIWASDPDQKELEKYYHKDKFSGDSKPFDPKNPRVIDFCNRFFRYANGDH